MKKIQDLVLGALLAAVLIAPAAWADATHLVQSGAQAAVTTMAVTKNNPAHSTHLSGSIRSIFTLTP